MAQLHIASPQALAQYVGQSLGASAWHLVTQAAVDQFAAATGDHQWIHSDVERCRRESPFGVPIAHGFFTLSLASACLAEVFEVGQLAMSINYGLNKVRFIAPVPVGGSVRFHISLLAVEASDKGHLATFQLSAEVQGGGKPACVAEMLALFVGLAA